MASARNPSSASIRPGGLVRPGLTTAQLPSVEFDPRPAYDWLTSACNDWGELEELLPEDRHWLEESRAALFAEMGSGDFARTCSGFMVELCRVLITHPDVRPARVSVVLIDVLTDH